MFVEVEHGVREFGNVGVHPALALQNAYELLPSAGTLMPYESFEERIAAVSYSRFEQQGIVHRRFLLRLLNDGRQLLVVAYEYEASDELLRVGAGGVSGEESYYVGFGYLSCLVDDGE